MTIHEIIKEIEKYNENDLIELQETIKRINKRKRQEKFNNSMKKAMEKNAEAMKKLADR